MTHIDHKTRTLFNLSRIVLIIVQLLLIVNTQAKSLNITDWLKMEGTAKEVTLTYNPSDVEIKIKLGLTIKNIGNKPVFIYEKPPQIGIQKLALSLYDDKNNNYAYKNSFGLANSYGSSDSLEEGKNLDQKFIPKKLFLIILPSEEEKLELITYITLTKRDVIGYEKNWIKISKQCENWLRVGIQPWAAGVLEKDYTTLKFGKKLQKRWWNEGYLALDYLISEPIKFTLPKDTGCR